MAGEPDYARAAKVMGVLLLVIGTLVIGMGVGVTSSMLVVTDNCEFTAENPEQYGAPQLDGPPACQEKSQTLSMWADCMYASGLFLLFAGVGSLYYLQRQAIEDSAEVAG